MAFHQNKLRKCIPVAIEKSSCSLYKDCYLYFEN